MSLANLVNWASSHSGKFVLATEMHNFDYIFYIKFCKSWRAIFKLFIRGSLAWYDW